MWSMVRNQRKTQEAKHMLREGNIGLLLKKIYRYIKNIVYDQWKFIYFEFPLDQPFPIFPNRESVKFRVATIEDIERVKTELFPVIDNSIENDKRYFQLIGKKDIQCFLAEKDNKLIHYSWAFTNLSYAPIMGTPFRKSKLKERDVFVGPVFTSPKIRGAWVFPYVLMNIIHYIKKYTIANRIILFVDGRNPAAVCFFERLGFKKI